MGYLLRQESQFLSLNINVYTCAVKFVDSFVIKQITTKRFQLIILSLSLSLLLSSISFLANFYHLLIKYLIYINLLDVIGVAFSQIISILNLLMEHEHISDVPNCYL